MLILMTGATGFIGGHLARRLIRSGYQVRALTRVGSKTDALVDMGAEVITGDIEDSGFIADSVSGCDLIINAAGKLGKWGASEEELRRVNVGMVKRLLEAAQQSSVKQFIHMSTPGVVGMVGVAPECMPSNPAGAYERTKNDAEKLAHSYHKKGTVPVTMLRPDFVYGPGDLHKLRMFKAIRDRRFPILGGGMSLIHPTYVDDVVDGTMLVIDNPTAYGHTFNLAGPAYVTVKQLVHTIADALDADVWEVRVPPVVLKMGALAVETACRVAAKEPSVTRSQIRFFTCDHASDISKAQEMLGYQPKVVLDEGIDRTIAWYKREGYL